jgi:hypothetical protein
MDAQSSYRNSLRDRRRSGAHSRGHRILCRGGRRSQSRSLRFRRTRVRHCIHRWTSRDDLCRNGLHRRADGGHRQGLWLAIFVRRHDPHGRISDRRRSFEARPADALCLDLSADRLRQCARDPYLAGANSSSCRGAARYLWAYCPGSRRNLRLPLHHEGNPVSARRDHRPDRADRRDRDACADRSRSRPAALHATCFRASGCAVYARNALDHCTRCAHPRRGRAP